MQKYELANHIKENNLLFLYVIASIIVSYLGYTLLAVAHAAILFIMFPLSVSLFLFNSKNYNVKKNHEVILLLVFIAIMILSVFLNMNRVKPDKSVFVISSSISILLTAPFVSEYENNSLQINYLKRFIWVFIGISFILSCVGVFFAFTRIVIEPNIGFVIAGRLRLIIHENILGMLMSLTISFIYFIFLHECHLKVWKTVFLIIAAVTCYLTMVYTDCRTAKITLMLTTFMFLFYLFNSRFLKLNKVIRISFGILCGIVACIVLWSLQSVLFGTVVKTLDRTTVETARAVSVDNDRMRIWTTAIKTFFQDKQSILFGASPALAKDAFLIANEDHFHNSYLAVLLNYGIFAFLVMCVFLIKLVKNMIQVVFTKDARISEGKRFLVFIVVSILLMGMTEELFVTSDIIHAFSIVLFVLIGYIFEFSKAVSNNDKILDS